MTQVGTSNGDAFQKAERHPPEEQAKEEKEEKKESIGETWGRGRWGKP